MVIRRRAFRHAAVAIGFLLGLKAAIAQNSGPSLPLSNTAGMEFVRIEPGEFMMGCFPENESCLAPEKPARRVRISRAFEISRYEVTQAQWQSVVGSNPSHFKGENHPVEQVSLNDVRQFLEKLNARNDGYRYRLPTEAEWEFAARAGGNDPAANRLADVAWFDANSERATHPVGQKQPNGWGLHDMLGNVSEWVQDRFGLDYYATGPSVDPTGPESGPNHVLRGGSWSGTSQQTRVSYRVQMAPSNGNATMGFRCVRVPQRAEQ